jgi:hypothetical protein
MRDHVHNPLRSALDLTTYSHKLHERQKLVLLLNSLSISHKILAETKSLVYAVLRRVSLPLYESVQRRSQRLSECIFICYIKASRRLAVATTRYTHWPKRREFTGTTLARGRTRRSASDFRAVGSGPDPLKPGPKSVK